MPDTTDPANSPPSGDALKAESYINRLIDLIGQDKLPVHHTDLKKLDPSSVQDHFRMELKDYQVEISHTKHPDSGKDFYVMLFTNVKHVSEGNSQKIILAYMYLNNIQFDKFKEAAYDQLERMRKAKEEKRLKEALAPVDYILDEISNHKSENYDSQNKKDDTSLDNFEDNNILDELTSSYDEKKSSKPATI